jgi:acetyl-CoA carboxylase biotin carboxyl carrier protein
MRHDPILALSIPDDDPTSASITLASPKIGRFTAQVREGQWVNPRLPLGWLWVLNTRYTLLAPDDASGVITHLDAPHREHPVPYGAPLLSLQPATLAGSPPPPRAARGDAALLHDLAPGAEVLRASMDGQFYRRASPDAPPFIDAGQVLQPGDTIGLIEVMKFFYPIRSEASGPRLVERVLISDTASVNAGHPILIWRPAP